MSAKEYTPETFRYIAPDAQPEPGTAKVWREDRRVLADFWWSDATEFHSLDPEVVGLDVRLHRLDAGRWELSLVYDCILIGEIVGVPEPAPWEATL